MPNKDLPFFIALAGPTASGKTAAALEIAKEFKGEIVSVDSALVYKGMDIGTAKPTPSEQQAAPHHLIDICEPYEPYSAAQFLKDTLRIIDEITARGKIPILTGGTMLYFNVLRNGLDELPAADPVLRSELEQQAQKKGWPAMHAELYRIDPVTARRLSCNDSQRIQRALEVFYTSSVPLSHFHRPAGRAALSFPLISLEPDNRTWLHERIAQRLAIMMQSGLLEEVERLRQDPRIHSDLPSMRSVGYRQTWQALSGEILMSALQERILFATRQLAKRQITWLRSMDNRLRVPSDSAHVHQNLKDLIYKIQSNQVT